MLWHTLRHLRGTQWQGRLRNIRQAAHERWSPRLVRWTLFRRVPATFDKLASPASAPAWMPKRHRGEHGMFDVKAVLDLRFQFLNREKQFTGQVCWRNPEFTYLWDFNLHYFEYLPALAELAHGSTGEQRERIERRMEMLIDTWIAGNPCPRRPAWHPYPLSLRICNWIKTLLIAPQLATPQRLRSLYAQVLFLEEHQEHHLLVNHLLENARALLFAGLFFSGRDALRWRATGQRLLQRELEEQLLDEGEHFERSPMYHAIVLEGLLDAYALLHALQEPCEWLRHPLLKMCHWLARIRTPDGWYPLFNDAARGISSSSDAILAHAAHLLHWQPPGALGPVRSADGLYVLQSKVFCCAVDGAPLGPDYNPGHAHADNFTFELFLRERRVVVDPGVYGYDADASRRWFRSSVSHNTVVVNQLDQSDVWGSFRVGRRSPPSFSHAGRLGEFHAFWGGYYNRLAADQSLEVERVILLHPLHYALVWDTIRAVQPIVVDSYCQFAPEWMVTGGRTSIKLLHQDGEALHFVPLACADLEILPGCHAPEFGKSLPTQRIHITGRDAHCVNMGYVISVHPLLGRTRMRREKNMLTLTIRDHVCMIDLEQLCV